MILNIFAIKLKLQRRNFISNQVLVVAIFSLLLASCTPKPIVEILPPASDYNFFIISDMGETLNYGNDSIATILNKLAPTIQPRFIISSGDFFHNAGVKSTTDSQWDLMNSKIFASPYMKIDVYPINGNHEYIGNPQATVDYSSINQHWKMEALNYTFVKKIDSIHSVRFVMINTSPFVEKYRRDPKYHSVNLQDWKKSTLWLDSVLRTSKEEWKVVVGHHPIFTSDFGQGSTYELIKYVDPLLKKYNVDMYFSGHIHKFEHVQRNDMDYFSTANGGSVPRIATPWFNTLFVKRTLGFTVCSVSGDVFSLFFVDQRGRVVYTFHKRKSAK
jgi:3',5'-cyclic AMP phosphodiesterase CpdA